uniref:Uncharacterized protein n=1 Tax=Arundo donax TaxID=35708 RepID=A0A0A8XRA2_ARUDO
MLVSIIPEIMQGCILLFLSHMHLLFSTRIFCLAGSDIITLFD